MPNAVDPHHAATITVGRIHGRADGHRRRWPPAVERAIATSDAAI
jgi:hypothetical protein